jgi:hypothetical protein
MKTSLHFTNEDTDVQGGQRNPIGLQEKKTKLNIPL